MRWYVVYSKPHKEGMAVFHLRRKDIEVFYPQLVLPDYLDVRRRVVPLFPNYLFVRLDLGEQYYDVVWAPGVKCFVGADGLPQALGDDVVTFLQQNATPEGTLRAQSDLRVGQEVEIARGPFAGLVGIIQRPPNAKGRIRVLMRLLNQRVVNVEVPLQYVKSNWVV